MIKQEHQVLLPVFSLIVIHVLKDLHMMIQVHIHQEIEFVFQGVVEYVRRGNDQRIK